MKEFLIPISCICLAVKFETHICPNQNPYLYSMNIQILSDLHLEFGIPDFNFSGADLVVFAGDIHTGIKGIQWIKEQIKNKPVIYILGNHEYYHGAYPKTLYKIREAAQDSNIHVLENKRIQIDGINFHGATLWTDFSIFGDPLYYGPVCQAKMNDYRRIRINPAYSKLRSIDTFRIHQKSMAWLEHSLTETAGEQNVVISHHAPSLRSVPEELKKDDITSAYASNLEAFIKKNQPKIWIHGHLHQPVDYSIEDTRIICNPHGYLDEKYKGFDHQLLIEL